MISRLFSSPLFRRLLCCLLALATVCLCLAPALVQPADAVVADTATLAVGLLFCSWAGVTFATNQGAATAVGNFLNSSVNGLKACSEVASKYVVDGSLALVQGVQDAFNSVLPDINSTFRTPDGSLDGALSGSYPLGVPLPLPTSPDMAIELPDGGSFSASWDGAVHNMSIVVDGLLVSVECSCGTCHFLVQSSSYYHPPYYICRSSGYFPFCALLPHDYYGKTLLQDYYFGPPQTAIDSIVLSGIEGISKTPFRKLNADYGIINDLAFAQPSSPAPNPTDPTDPSETPDPSNPSTPSKDSILAGFKDPMFWGLMGMLGIIRNETGYDASKVDPEALIKQLQDLLNKAQTDPEPTPTEAPEPTEQPQPEPEPSEATKPTTSPDTPTDPPESDEDLGKPHPADWKGVFPFCVPFDLIEFLGILAAEPEAPVIRWRFYVPNVVDQEIVLDLSVFDSVAQIVRTMELLAFCVGLILLTRNIIRG